MCFREWSAPMCGHLGIVQQGFAEKESYPLISYGRGLLSYMRGLDSPSEKIKHH